MVTRMTACRANESVPAVTCGRNGSISGDAVMRLAPGPLPARLGALLVPRLGSAPLQAAMIAPPSLLHRPAHLPDDWILHLIPLSGFDEMVELRHVHAHAPGAACVNGCSAVLCWSMSHCRSAGTSGAGSSPASASAPMDSVVAHVARFVSIGQLPSERIESIRNVTPAATTGLSACPAPARLITTKLVRGVASRYPPLAGCISRNTRCVRARTAFRRDRVIGLRDGANR